MQNNEEIIKNQFEVVKAFEGEIAKCFKILTLLIQQNGVPTSAFSPNISNQIYEAERSLREAKMKDRIIELNSQLKAKDQLPYGKLRIKSKNAETLEGFVKYCKVNPDLRFWQALRTWSGHSFIFFGDGPYDDPELEDTFHIE
jgi:hypothetical protein